MAEVHTSDTANKPVTPSERTPLSVRPGDSSAEKEHRSFQGDGDPARGAALMGRRFANEMVEAGARMAAMSRQGPFSGAQFWVQSIEPFYAMQAEMWRWMDDLWRQTTTGLRPAQPSRAMSFGPLVGLPPTDIKETDNAYRLSVELPGLEKNDVEVSVQGDTLVVSGHKAEEREEATTAYRLSERRFGRFERTFPLPPNVMADRLEANFKDGLLTVMVPKDPLATPAKGQRAQIRA
jgi:HSP20 family protein